MRRRRKPEYIPTPAEIAAACREILAERERQLKNMAGRYSKRDEPELAPFVPKTYRLAMSRR